jgi:hypothetical protein
MARTIPSPPTVIKEENNYKELARMQKEEYESLPVDMSACDVMIDACIPNILNMKLPIRLKATKTTTKG